MILDDHIKIQELDSKKMHASIEQLDKQIQQTWEEVSMMTLPESYKSIKNIVFAGMGGSSLGGYVIEHMYALQIRIPYRVVNDYHLPAYVDQDTLVIVESYSGTTEETVSALHDALAKKAKIIVITAGGELEKIALSHSLPLYKIEPRFNPSNQPRMAIGYHLFALIVILSRLDVIKFEESELTPIIKELHQTNENNGITIPTTSNRAKQFANKLYNRIPIFIAGEFLMGAAHTTRNQINENTKSLAVYFPLPESNHHLLESLDFPERAKDISFFTLLNSNLYSPKIRKRLIATEQIISENHHKTEIIEAQGTSKLAQVLSSIHFGSYVGYYLSLLYGIDPSPIVRVEEFKKILSQ